MTAADVGAAAGSISQDDADHGNEPPPDGANQDGANQDSGLSDAGKRALDRIKAQRDEFRNKHTQTAAERDQLAAELQKFKDQNLSELELAKRDREAAQAELAELRQQAETFRLSDLRKQIALDKGLPASLVGMLQGSTEEEITAYTDALLEVLSKNARPGVKADPSQGARGTGTSTPQQQFAAAMQNLL